MVEIDPSGALTTEDNLPDIKLGSVFPKANLAWNNRFEWRGISLSALFTARIGGIAYSATQAAMDQYGVSERSAQARDNGGVLLNGRTLVDAQTYYSLIGNSKRIAAVLHLQCYERAFARSQCGLYHSPQMAGRGV